MKATITGIQEAQAANARMIANMRPSGALGRMVWYAVQLAQRYAIVVTHVDTGGLRASHRMKLEGSRGFVYIDPTAHNPVNRGKPSIYGPAEHNRGGTHAFYERTEREAGLSIARDAATEFAREVVR